jgi:hypothetical protein
MFYILQEVNAKLRVFGLGAVTSHEIFVKVGGHV